MTETTSITKVSASSALDHIAARLVAVGEVGRDVELDAGAGLGTDEPVVPPLDHTAGAEHHREGLATLVAVVELDAVLGAHADVVDGDGVADLGLGALAGLQHRDDEVLRQCVGDLDVGLRQRLDRRRVDRWQCDLALDRFLVVATSERATDPSDQHDRTERGDAGRAPAQCVALDGPGPLGPGLFLQPLLAVGLLTFTLLCAHD